MMQHYQRLPIVAEALEIKEALIQIKEKGYEKVDLESDCVVVKQAIHNNTLMNSYFGRVIKECKHILSELKSRLVYVKFVKHSPNSVEHFPAKSYTIASDHRIGAFYVPSDFCSVLLNGCSI